ncbi:zinc finger protein 14-like [Armigeres subalbatus]|uniref:zinc finger protein 14-like n=1 Tax=Armigeres subalbatus TaxID=124917 RepID=UPI002ED5B9D4
MDMDIQNHQMELQPTVSPTSEEFISLHGWMLSHLNLQKIISSEFSAEQNCKNVLKYINNFPWSSDKKEITENANVQLPAMPCLSPMDSTSSTSDQEPAKESVAPDNQMAKMSSTFDKRRFKLYKNSEFSCQPCGRNFGTKGSYTQHCKAHHSGPMDHRCGNCGKRFPTEAKMKLHERLHTMKDKPFKCGQCSKQFIYSHDLKRHEVKRHGQGNCYVCKVCGLKLTRPDALALHEISHNKKTG